MTTRLSYSQLNSWTHCGEQYRLERIVRVPRRPGWALIGGNAVHTLTEEHDLRQLGVALPERTWDEVFEELTVEAEEESGLDRSEFKASGRVSQKWPNKEDAAWWAAEGPAMVRRWVTFRQVTPWEIWTTPNGEPAVELKFELTLLDGEVVIVGYIDRVFEVDGQLVVFDLKSGSRPQPTPRQLGTYALAVRELFDVDVPWGTFWDARKGATSPVHPMGRFTRERLDYQYGAIAHARETGLYLPNPSNMCASCDVRDFCYEVGGDRANEVSAPWEPVRVYQEPTQDKEAAA